MEIRIGITNASRELSFETNQPVAELEKLIATQVAEGDDGMVRLEDAKGHVYLIPVKSLGYVELADEPVRKVGFAP
ncbi:MAG: DUF3107 domain-containing protein [Pontimonas sp.]